MYEGNYIEVFNEACAGKHCRKNCVIYKHMVEHGVRLNDTDCYIYLVDNIDELAPVIVGEKQEQTEKTDVINDPVSHPSHYTFGTIEVIDAIEDWQLPFHLANVVKYVARAGKKDPDKLIEDLQKASWYLNRYIEYLTKDL